MPPTSAGWASNTTGRRRPRGVVVCEYFCSGLCHSANAGWINLGDGAPADGIRYSNTAGADSGVNHDGRGNLSGLAWGANVGWLNFGWASATDPDRPRIDLQTGTFDGFVWGANVGWLNLGDGRLETDAILYLHDSDGDGISDPWELENVGDLATMDAESDFDGDGDPDLMEYCWGTDPTDPMDAAAVSIGLDLLTGTVTATWRASSRRQYLLEHSADLTSWTMLSGIFSEPDGVAIRSVSDPALGIVARRLYRMSSSKPLAP